MEICFNIIDNDETPEMLIEGNSQADGCLVLSLQSGEIAEMQTYRVSFSYIEKKGLCGYDTYDQGETYSVYYELKDGKFKNISSSVYMNAGEIIQLDSITNWINL